MPKKLVQVEVESSVADILGALAKAIADSKAAVKSGQSGVALITSIGAALVADLAPVIAEVAQIPADVQDSAQDCVAAILVSVPALIAAVKS